MAKKDLGRRSRGLGDDLEKIFEKTGIKYVVDTTFDALGVDCGCDERKERLNKIFPNKKPECLTKDEYDFLTPIFGKTSIKPHEQAGINTIYKRVFNEKAKATSCAPCLSDRINKLHAVYDAYESK